MWFMVQTLPPKQIINADNLHNEQDLCQFIAKWDIHAIQLNMETMIQAAIM